MSIIYCEKHDRRWDSDKLEECSRCETEDKPQQTSAREALERAAMIAQGCRTGGVDAEYQYLGHHLYDERPEDAIRALAASLPQGEQERHDWWKAKFEEAERLYLDCNETRGKLAHQLIMQGEAGE